MSHVVLMVVGPPAVGKTSALRFLALPSEKQTEDTEVRWTLREPYAFIGHYENKILDGGDRVARHANLLCLEYWKRYILPNPRYKVTILDGEMYLWSVIFEELNSQRLKFVDVEDPRCVEYKPGGLRHKTYSQIMDKDPVRFPPLPGSTGDIPNISFNCVHLVASPETCLARRRGREASAETGATINSDHHMKTAASKQRNFAERFVTDTPFFMEEKNPLGYLKVDVETKTPQEVAQIIDQYARSLSS